jgi:penicillin-insensitive murein endopeptidase
MPINERFTIPILLTTFLLFMSAQSIQASEAIGYYSSGSLRNAVSIDDFSNTPGLIKLFRNRGQIYGVKELSLALDGLASHMRSLYPSIEAVQVGDMASKNGGKIPRHKSHQNGLDADVVYYRVNESAQSPSNTEWAEYFVVSKKLIKNFHAPRNWEAFKYLVENYNVSRILVDGAIKKEMCSLAKSLGEHIKHRETLRRLRIENTVHKTHYHLRLKCPQASPNCRAQVEPPSGSGC